MASRPIDEKIVAMKMDNSDFKRKASETVGLFGKLSDSLSRVKDINLNSITGAFGKMKDSLAGVNKVSFSGITNSLAGIKSAASQVDMSTLASNVDNVTQRFGTLNTVATTALATITAKASLAGANLLNNLGPAQITGGFQEYEKKMGSIGTMLSNTEWAGSTLDDVKNTLGELNDYADDTIYSFGQMTDNIGRFTAAGVTLEDSATAIKGLGNLAAVSGSNTDQLNTAMYQMSQALSSGKLNLMDWNSLINAGMGGKKTQDALLETAQAMGHNVDMTDGFRNSIEQGWLTSEVLLATLQKFGNDESMTKAATSVRTFTGMMSALQEGIGSGWSESFEIIFGDFNEATKLWTGLSNIFKGIFDTQAKVRNGILRTIFDGGGLANLLGAIMNIGRPFVQVFKAIGAGLKMAFPSSMTGGIAVFLEMFQYLTKNMELSGKTVNNIKTIFAGFFSIFAIGFKIISGAVSIIIALLPSFSGLGSKLVELIAIIAAIPLAFNETRSSGETFYSFLDILKTIAGGVATALTFVVGGLIYLAGAVGQVIGVLARGDFKAVGPWSEDSFIVNALLNIREALSSFVGAVNQIWNIFTKRDYVSGGPWDEDEFIVNKMFEIRDGVADAVGAIQQAWSILTKGKFMSDGPWKKDSGIVEFLMSIREGFEAINFSKIGNGFMDFFSWLGNGISTAIDKIKEFGQTVKDMMPSTEQLIGGGAIAGMLTVVAAVLKVMWDLFTGWTGIGAGIKDTLDSVTGAINGFTAGIYVQALLTIAIALGVLAVSFWLLSDIPAKDLAKSLYIIMGGLSALVLAMFVMTKYDITGTGMKAAVQIMALAVAFGIISVAMKLMGNMDWDEVAKGIVGLAGVMGIFSLAIIAISKFGGAGVATSSLQFIALAGSMLLMFMAVKAFGNLDTDVLIKGVTTLGVVLLALGTFSKLASGSGLNAGSAAGMVGVVLAVLGIVAAVVLIAYIPTDMLVKGLYTVTIILAALAAFAYVTGPGLLGAGVGVAFIAAALLLLTIPIGILGNMDTETLAKGLYSISIALVAIGLASMMMTGMVAAGAGMAIMAGALILLLIPIGAFAAMSWEGLLKGMLGLAASLLIIGGAAALLTPAIPSIGALGIVVAILGAGMALAGLGIALFTTGMVTAAAMTGTAVITIVSMLGTLIGGLVAMIPVAVDFGAKVIQHIAVAIETNAPILYEKFLNLALKLLTIFDQYIPQFTAKAGDIIRSFIDGMAVEIPSIVESITGLLVLMAAAVEANSAPFTNAFLTIMEEVAVMMTKSGAAVIDALFGWIPGVGEVTSQIGKTAELNIREAFDAQQVATDKGDEYYAGLLAQKAKAKEAAAEVGKGSEEGADTANLNPIGDEKGGGFIDGLIANLGGSLTAGTGLGTSAETGAGTANLNPMGTEGGQGFVSGLLSKTGTSQNAGSSLADSSESGAGTANLSPIGSGHGADFASGVSSKVSAARTAGTAVAQGADSGAGSVDATQTGKDFGQGFANGISAMKTHVSNAASVVAAGASYIMKKVLETRSPSKVTTRIGNDTGQGLANGIAAKKKNVEDAAKKVAEAAAKAFAHSKSYIDDQKYYNHIGLAQELNAWERVQKRYKKGTDQRKEADKEVYRLKNDINKALIATNDEYVKKVQEANKQLIADEKALNDEYKKSVADRAKSLSGFVGLFDKVEKDSKTSGAVLLENLKGQVTTFTDWKNDLQALGKKGIYSGLLAELTEMGPKAADEIAALNTMTNDQLKEYSQLWGQKNQLAVAEAERELKPLKDSTVKEIAALRSATAKELDVYKKEWMAKIREIRYGTGNEFVGLNTSMRTIGVDAITGMMKGMQSMSSPLAKQAKALANSVASTIKSTLQIKSPSRVAFGFGKFFGEGLGNGIGKMGRYVIDKTKGLAYSAKDSLNKFIEGFEVAPEDNEIHFKAVIDYDGFNPGVGKVPVNMVPDTSRTKGLIASTRASFRQNDDRFQREPIDQSSTTNEYKYDIHVNANGTMSRPEVRKLAMQIRDEIKDQDDRSKISKGKEVVF